MDTKAMKKPALIDAAIELGLFRTKAAAKDLKVETLRGMIDNYLAEHYTPPVLVEAEALPVVPTIVPEVAVVVASEPEPLPEIDLPVIELPPEAPQHRIARLRARIEQIKGEPHSRRRIRAMERTIRKTESRLAKSDDLNA